jgi:RNA polymerase sigma factor (sigma-70 family)
MSPSTLRRYRAERLLRAEFGGLRGEVLRSVRGRLRARGVHIDGGDLEACYAQAWQGLYTAIAAGEEVANPGGWLTVVTFRRAIDEHRATHARRNPPQHASAAEPDVVAAAEPDLAAELDDRARLRQLFEALRSRLSARECEAASLCYLQGLTRAQAAQRMGISEARMGKLMEGAGPGRPGVARKVGELLELIQGGTWCEQQASTMRGLAFGILDPRGERYRLARLHQRECPACRAYILALRGLAAVLPPLPLPWDLRFGPPTPPPSPSSPTTPTHVATGAKAGTGAGAGAGTISASGAAGIGGAAGGGWLLGGSMGAKLAASCVLALSVGCVALGVVPHRAEAHHRHAHEEGSVAGIYSANAAPLANTAPIASGTSLLGGAFSGRSSSRTSTRDSGLTAVAIARRASAGHAQREFGPEQPASATGSTLATGDATSAIAHAASRGGGGAATRGSSTGGNLAGGNLAGEGRTAGESASPGASDSHPRTPPSHAEREFGPE